MEFKDLVSLSEYQFREAFAACFERTKAIERLRLRAEELLVKLRKADNWYIKAKMKDAKTAHIAERDYAAVYDKCNALWDELIKLMQANMAFDRLIKAVDIPHCDKIILYDYYICGVCGEKLARKHNYNASHLRRKRLLALKRLHEKVQLNYKHATGCNRQTCYTSNVSKCEKG